MRYKLWVGGLFLSYLFEIVFILMLSFDFYRRCIFYDS